MTHCVFLEFSCSPSFCFVIIVTVNTTSLVSAPL